MFKKKKEKRREQKREDVGESSLALQSQERFGEVENRFSRDHEGKGLPASDGQSTQQRRSGEQLGAGCWVVTSAAPRLGWEEICLGAKFKLAHFYLIKL